MDGQRRGDPPEDPAREKSTKSYYFKLVKGHYTSGRRWVGFREVGQFLGDIIDAIQSVSNTVTNLEALLDAGAAARHQHRLSRNAAAQVVRTPSHRLRRTFRRSIASRYC